VRGVGGDGPEKGDSKKQDWYPDEKIHWQGGKLTGTSQKGEQHSGNSGVPNRGDETGKVKTLINGSSKEQGLTRGDGTKGEFFYKGKHLVERDAPELGQLISSRGEAKVRWDTDENEDVKEMRASTIEQDVSG